MNYRSIINCASILSGMMILADNFLTKEYPHIFVRFSILSVVSFTGLVGYTAFLKLTRKDKTSFEGVLDIDAPLTIRPVICPDTFYYIKLGDSDFGFLLIPGESRAKLVLSRKENGIMELVVSSEGLEFSSNEFWFGTIKIIKL